MKINAAEESFELMEMLGQTVLFTNMRVDRSTVPEGLHIYEVRDDDCNGEICEIKPSVMVNHWGTIICKEPIEMDEYWHSRFVDVSDYCYLGDTAKLEEYINTDYSEEQSDGLELS
jgi:hypothetical protein